MRSRSMEPMSPGVKVTMYTVTDVALLCGVHRNTVVRWINQGLIHPTAKLSSDKGAWLFDQKTARAIRAQFGYDS